MKFGVHTVHHGMTFSSQNFKKIHFTFLSWKAAKGPEVRSLGLLVCLYNFKRGHNLIDQENYDSAAQRV